MLAWYDKPSPLNLYNYGLYRMNDQERADKEYYDWIAEHMGIGNRQPYPNTQKYLDEYSSYESEYKKLMPDHDPVNNPKHYTNHPSGIECIQITEHMSFTLGNAVKYIWRADLKNGVEDLEKAIWYLQREMAKRKKA